MQDSSCVLCISVAENISQSFLLLPVFCLIWSLCKLKLGLTVQDLSLEEEGHNLLQNLKASLKAIALVRVVL